MPHTPKPWNPKYHSPSPKKPPSTLGPKTPRAVFAIVVLLLRVLPGRKLRRCRWPGGALKPWGPAEKKRGGDDFDPFGDIPEKGALDGFRAEGGFGVVLLGLSVQALGSWSSFPSGSFFQEKAS